MITLEAALTVGSAVATVASMWGFTRAQTSFLKEKLESLAERLRHHTESDHPALDDRLRATETELAVLKSHRGRLPTIPDQENAE